MNVYARDGVPVYGLCRDTDGSMMTSCYKLNPGSSTETTVTVSGTYTDIGTNQADYTYTPVSMDRLYLQSGKDGQT